MHTTTDGTRELILVEWKYTESYRPGDRRDEWKDEIRWKRYGEALEDPDGPVRPDLLGWESLLHEPFYQLMRQQLLAHELEKDGAHGAERVRVVHVTPAANLEYQRSLNQVHRELGSTVYEVWQQQLRRPDRFVPVDSRRLFLDPEITAWEYDSRYGDHLAWDEAELLRLCGDVEDYLYAAVEFDGDVEITDDGVLLTLGHRTTGLHYPFSVHEFWDVSAELDRALELDYDQ